MVLAEYSAQMLTAAEATAALTALRYTPESIPYLLQYADARAAITLGDALPNVTVVGAMAVPLDVPTPIRDVVVTAELVRGTGKPTRTWPVTSSTSTSATCAPKT